MKILFYKLENNTYVMINDKIKDSDFCIFIKKTTDSKIHYVTRKNADLIQLFGEIYFSKQKPCELELEYKRDFIDMCFDSLNHPILETLCDLVGIK